MVRLFISGSNRKAPALAGAFFDSVLSIANEGELIGIVDPSDGVEVRRLVGLTRILGDRKATGKSECRGFNS